MFDKDQYLKRLTGYVQSIREVTDFVPETAIILGSGLGDFADHIDVQAVIDYHDLEGFPVSTAPGHAGQYILGTLGEKKVICMKGRVHYYEGYEPEEVVLPLRVMYLLGARNLIITNAVGCVNTRFSVGSFMVSRDAITTFVPSPLRGPNLDELGPRFVDVSNLYDRDLRRLILQIGKENGIEVNEGVLVQLQGPQFETATEIQMIKALGGDCCGMSSAVEAVAAAHMGMRTAGISCITNYGTGISPTKLTAEEVIEAADKASGNFEILIKQTVERM